MKSFSLVFFPESPFLNCPILTQSEIGSTKFAKQDIENYHHFGKNSIFFLNLLKIFGPYLTQFETGIKFNTTFLGRYVLLLHLPQRRNLSCPYSRQRWHLHVNSAHFHGLSNRSKNHFVPHAWRKFILKEKWHFFKIAYPLFSRTNPTRCTVKIQRPFKAMPDMKGTT